MHNQMKQLLLEIGESHLKTMSKDNLEKLNNIRKISSNTKDFINKSSKIGLGLAAFALICKMGGSDPRFDQDIECGNNFSPYYQGNQITAHSKKEKPIEVDNTQTHLIIKNVSEDDVKGKLIQLFSRLKTYYYQQEYVVPYGQDIEIPLNNFKDDKGNQFNPKKEKADGVNVAGYRFYL